MWSDNRISANLATSLRSLTCLERKNRNRVDAASSAESSSLSRTLHASHRVRNSPRLFRDSLPVFPPAALLFIFGRISFEAFGCFHFPIHCCTIFGCYQDRLPCAAVAASIRGAIRSV